MFYMPKNLASVIVVLAMAIGLASCASQAVAPEKEPEAYNVPEETVQAEETEEIPYAGFYYNEEFGFSMEFPYDWEQEEGSGNIVIQAFSPLEGDDDLFRENINVTAVNTPDVFSYEEFLPELKKVLAGQTENFQVVSEGDTVVDTYQAKWCVYTFTMDGNGIKGKLFVVFAGHTVFSIACTATPESFEKYAEQFENIISTLIIDGSSDDSSADEPVPPREREYTIQFPEGWAVDETITGTEIAGISPAESGDDNFRENITVITEYLPEGATFDEFFNTNIDSIKELSDSPEEMSFGQMEIGGMEAKWIIYPYGFGDDKIKMASYMLEKDGKIYLINGAAQYGTFDKFREIFENTAATFRLK